MIFWFVSFVIGVLLTVEVVVLSALCDPGGIHIRDFCLHPITKEMNVFLSVKLNLS